MQMTDKMTLPGSELSASKMPGHWLLARLGKRVLRPGGLNLTRQLLESLAIQLFGYRGGICPRFGCNGADGPEFASWPHTRLSRTMRQPLPASGICWPALASNVW